MTSQTRVTMNSFQGSRAILDLHYADRHARLEFDRMEDRYEGQPTEERAREEISRVVDALKSWLERKDARIEGA